MAKTTIVLSETQQAILATLYYAANIREIWIQERDMVLVTEEKSTSGVRKKAVKNLSYNGEDFCFTELRKLGVNLRLETVIRDYCPKYQYLLTKNN